MPDLLSQLHRTLQQHRLTQASFVLAYSGGLDSTALLSLFARLKLQLPQIQLRAIHVHHGLSPNADNWVQHCQQECAQLQIPLIIEKVRLAENSNLEQAARNARYRIFKQHLQADELLVTAHHLNDQSETLLLALKRGSGVKGLSAMQVRSELWQMPIFRPLLPMSRMQLQQYAQQQRLRWIEDESNQDNRYDRNFLRNHILPTLRQRWAQIDSTLQRSAQHCFEQQQLLEELLLPLFQQHYRAADRTFDLSGFADYSRHKQQFLLRLWLEKNALMMPSQLQLTQLIENVVLAQTDKQPQLQLADSVIRRYQQRLYLTDIYQDITDCVITPHFDQPIELPDNLGSLVFQQQAEQLCVLWQQAGQQRRYCVAKPVADQLIQIRFAYSGKVRLAANRPNSDIKKIWQQYGIPPWQRQRTPLLFYGDKLIAALGVFSTV
ncbi:tRNA lysidine(34) synthetase TilS [Testudinibacter aquarius]|uniref:tRNA(Ile)-lysidine synthase n=1 Tax=Testudinibacter aquarius TaxID=1524974 RepID=A0A4R3XXZ1_9PAST|nr:tRNA lysidine(34) synthetase TilS [Testudinibacter aquarius]KAE9530285.1 tRNA(Ile)-lysidine synthase [Testudinibacter aquarius]TCV84176.1 tRNA(Ile)-lysidine synthase [Testudinibacter aquarius]TNG86996.1 tRNA lysidine(34) synthetase TilS [Testudinibacter aquarius]